MLSDEMRGTTWFGLKKKPQSMFLLLFAIIGVIQKVRKLRVGGRGTLKAYENVRREARRSRQSVSTL